MNIRRKEVRIGILALVLNLILGRFTSTPAFVSGVLIGLSFCFNLIGILPESTYNKLKGWKKQKLSRII
jgi:hypothetical protein